MAKYSDALYSDSLTALIGDIYYASGVSFDTKIARMRSWQRLLSED